jgi:hypothetical protein
MQEPFAPADLLSALRDLLDHHMPATTAHDPTA